MRVLFISNFYPPDSLGGVQLYTHGLARELLRRGHAVQVLATGEWNSGPKHLNGVADDVYENVAVRRLHLSWARAPDPFRYLYNNPVVQHETDRLLAEFCPDVVHVTSPSHLSASVIFAAKSAGFPVVLTLPDYWLICPRFTLQHADGHICDGNVAPWQCIQCLAWGAKVYRWPSRILPGPIVARLLAGAGRVPQLTRQRGLIGMVGNIVERRQALRRAFEIADVVLAISQYVKDVFARSGQVEAERIRVHEWGIPEISIPLRPRANPGTPVRFAYFGRLAPIKGVHILIEAFHQVRGPVELHFHGSAGPEDADYERLLRQLAGHDNRIYFHGSYRREDIGILLTQTDGVVVPSIGPETYNLVAREALLANTPVIASDIGALPEAIWHERNGLLIRPGDVADLASALQRLVDAPELRERLASGPRRIKTVAQEMDELMAIYRSLVDRPEHGGF